MGVDLTAYSNLVKASAQDAVSGDYVTVFKNEDFPNRADEFEDGAVYEYSDFLYFLRMPYSGYNRWRNQLAQLAGYPLKTFQHEYGERESHCVDCWNGSEGPFSELINFSDCEGFLGTSVCVKLFADFENFHRAVTHYQDKQFAEIFFKWHGALKLASNGGGIDFS